MLRKELLQVRMVRHKLLVVHQRWIPAQLFGNLRMRVHEPVHVRQFSACHIAITRLIFPPVKALFLTHKSVRVLAQLFAHFRMLLQILLQVTMPFHKFLIVYQRRIPANLLGKLGVTV